MQDALPQWKLYGPGTGSVALYCEMRPHSTIRARVLIRASTALRMSPPTFSKAMSIPSGQFRFSPLSTDSGL